MKKWNEEARRLIDKGVIDRVRDKREKKRCDGEQKLIYKRVIDRVIDKRGKKNKNVMKKWSEEARRLIYKTVTDKSDR